MTHFRQLQEAANFESLDDTDAGMSQICTEEDLETYNTPKNLSTPRQIVAPSMLRLGEPDLLDVKVTEYSMWQQSRVGSETLKANTQKLCEVALEHGFDLQQISEEIKPEFFVEEGVKLGVAMRFKRDTRNGFKNSKKNVS